MGIALIIGGVIVAAILFVAIVRVEYAEAVRNETGRHTATRALQVARFAIQQNTRTREDIVMLKDQVAGIAASVTQLQTDFETYRDGVDQKIADAIAAAEAAGNADATSALTDLQTQVTALDAEVKGS